MGAALMGNAKHYKWLLHHFEHVRFSYDMTTTRDMVALAIIGGSIELLQFIIKEKGVCIDCYRLD